MLVVDIVRGLRIHAQRRRERERVEAGGGGCRRRGSREERVRALGRRRCTFPSSLPVQLYLHGVTCPINREEQRWYSPVDGLRIRCRLSLLLLFPMLLLYTCPLCIRICILYIQFCELSPCHANPIQFKLRCSRGVVGRGIGRFVMRTRTRH